MILACGMTVRFDVLLVTAARHRIEDLRLLLSIRTFRRRHCTHAFKGSYLECTVSQAGLRVEPISPQWHEISTKHLLPDSCRCELSYSSKGMHPVCPILRANVETYLFSSRVLIVWSKSTVLRLASRTRSFLAFCALFASLWLDKAIKSSRAKLAHTHLPQSNTVLTPSPDVSLITANSLAFPPET